jgi:micrococcal nuclease
MCRAVALLVVLAGCAVAGAPDPADSGHLCGPTEATVARVIDGDTIVLESGERVRYLLLDAPETTLGHADCYGSNATQFNSDLVAGRRIALTYDVQCDDSYGRLLAYVSVDGTEVNPLLVARGYACVLRVPPNGAGQISEFEDLEARARQERLGVWSCDPVPPACRG